jgi:hypothetical protein
MVARSVARLVARLVASIYIYRTQRITPIITTIIF